jgi:hypothetical protein
MLRPVRTARSRAVLRTLKAFVGLVFRPLRGAWNSLGVGLPGLIAALLWGSGAEGDNKPAEGSAARRPAVLAEELKPLLRRAGVHEAIAGPPRPRG